MHRMGRFIGLIGTVPEISAGLHQILILSSIVFYFLIYLILFYCFCFCCSCCYCIVLINFYFGDLQIFGKCFWIPEIHLIDE